MEQRHIGLMAAAVMLTFSACASYDDRPASSTPPPTTKQINRAEPTQPGPAVMGETRQTPSRTVTPRDPESAPPAPITPEPSQPRTSNNRGGDPVQACMDRIPKEATSGQRAMAEQGCTRDYSAFDVSPYASGTQGDTLQACVKRIPSDASAGQRMIAEESCQRDEGLRHELGLIPER